MRRSLLSALLLSGALAACRPSQLPGESLGQFEVGGMLRDTTCGAGHDAPEALRFFVELRRGAGQTGYWKISDVPQVEGRLDGGGAFTFEQRQEAVAIEADPQGSTPGCVLAREETVRGLLRRAGAVEDGGREPDAGSLDGGAEAGDGGGGAEAGDGGGDRSSPAVVGFEGSTTIVVSASRGDCAPVTAAAGGPFPTLPCELRYDLLGERLEEPLW